MRNIKLGIVYGLFLMTACKKSSYNNILPVAALNVINAAPDVPSMNVSFADTATAFYKYQNPISYGASYEFSPTPEQVPVVIVSSADTLSPIYQATLSLKDRGIYSLYVLGGVAKGDVLFMQDSIPVYTDSSAGIRFINCSADNRPFTVNLLGNDPSQTEVAGLSYKQISAFKPYDARIIGGSYTFEIRDPALPDPIATFSWNYILNKNYTVVISGSQSSGITVFQVNNF
jgi:hypothetical protein